MPQPQPLLPSQLAFRPACTFPTHHTLCGSCITSNMAPPVKQNSHRAARKKKNSCEFSRSFVSITLDVSCARACTAGNGITCCRPAEP